MPQQLGPTVPELDDVDDMLDVLVLDVDVLDVEPDEPVETEDVLDVEVVSPEVVVDVTTPVPPLPPGVSSTNVGVFEHAAASAPEANQPARIARALTVSGYRPSSRGC